MIKNLLLALNIGVSPYVTVSDNSLQIVEDLRKVYTGGVVITSNYRGKERNRRAGGSPESKHLCGKAIDIKKRGLTKQDIRDIQKLDKDKYFILIEQDHIHIQLEEKC